MERKRTSEKIWCSHARANVVVCCVLFHKIYIKPLELTGKCLQKIASNTFHCYSVPNSLSLVLGPILICTHTVIYPACPLLPFSGIICSEVTAKVCFWMSISSSVILCCMLHLHHSCKTLYCSEWHKFATIQGTADFFPSTDRVFPRKKLSNFPQT